MYKNFKIAYITHSQKISKVFYDTFQTFKKEMKINHQNLKVSKVVLDPEKLKYLIHYRFAVVIFDNLRIEEISSKVIKKIKNVFPYTYFIYFCKKYDHNLFLNVLKKEIEFCVSLDFFDNALFFQTIKNIFKKIYKLMRLNHIIVFCDDLTVNLIDRKVWQNGVEINLTETEFNLFKFFVEHPNAYFSNNKILSRVWGYNEDNTGIVNQYVFRLKKKIGSKSFIRNNQGFCFRVDDFNFF